MYIACTVENNGPKICATSEIVKKCPKKTLNQRTKIGPNLVTLVGILYRVPLPEKLRQKFLKNINLEKCAKVQKAMFEKFSAKILNERNYFTYSWAKMFTFFNSPVFYIKYLNVS
jgi:gamma-glutamylcysteine synthetase